MSDEYRELLDEAEKQSSRVEKLKKELAEAEGELESKLLQLKALRYEGDSDENFNRRWYDKK